MSGREELRKWWGISYDIFLCKVHYTAKRVALEEGVKREERGAQKGREKILLEERRRELKRLAD